MNDEVNEVTLLKRDHTYIRIPEDQLTEEMLLDSLFYMVRTSPDPGCRNFVVAKPNKRLIFDKAIINFKLSTTSIFDRWGDGELYESEDGIEKHIETSSLTILISIINVIDRLVLLDVLMDDENVGDKYTISVNYMHVTLYKGNKISYESGCTNSYSDSHGYNPYKLTKAFSKIYKPITYLSGITSGDTLFMSTNGHWMMNTDFSHKKGMIGIVAPASATVTFCTKREYDKLKDAKRSSITASVYAIFDEEEIGMTEVLNQSILSGTYENLIDMGLALDFFFENTIEFRSYRYYLPKIVDFVAHSAFLIEMSNLLHDDFFYLGETNKCPANTVLYIRLENIDGDYKKHIYMTKDTLVSPNDIFNSL